MKNTHITTTGRQKTPIEKLIHELDYQERIGKNIFFKSKNIVEPITARQLHEQKLVLIKEKTRK